ncbi:MAG: hypothetical protein CVT93_08500 [Bacteroidetes bacterium HGW-Bacteroidetes-10]|nr:MAG: hypothetical protein CVT93_08500 [Bacteroidetes bacterium HGW-Bacteroidetes-10]
MNKIIDFPRVLIIYNSRINTYDQHGVSIRGWFADWPKENLAQIYSGGEVGEFSYSGYNFKLGPKERRFGNIFLKLKGSSIGQSSYTITLTENFSQLKKLSYWSLFKNRISEWVIISGFWELIFKPKLSKELVNFVRDFEPHIIYCQGYSLTFSWIPVMLNKKINVPICFQTGDDWPSNLYKNTPFSTLIRPIVQKAVKELFNRSSIRLANGIPMAKEYMAKYGANFEPLMMCDNLKRFKEVDERRLVKNSAFSIIYTGNLGSDRWTTIIDLSKAVNMLVNKGFDILVTVFAITIPPEAVGELQKCNNIQILPNPTHEELPSYLKGADILFLPESFDSEQARSISLSISTKAHLYMMSEKPILVYAPSITGTVKYAMEEGWAHIVQEKGSDKLAKAILFLLENKKYCSALVSKGIEVAAKNHDELKVRAKFLTRLSGLKTNQENR